jgi:hypothetical protein
MKRLLPLLFLLALAFLPTKANATACTAGCVKYIDSTAFSGSSISATLPTVTAGNGMHGMVCYDGPTAISSATVGAGSITVSTHTAASAYTCTLLAFANMASGSNVVTINFTGTCTGCNLHVEEWAGDATSSLLDGSAGTYTTDGTAGTSLPSGNFTTTGSNDTNEVMLFQTQNIAPTAVTSGYTVAASDISNSFYTAYKASNGAGTYNPAFTSATGSTDNYVVAGGFQQSGGGSPAPKQSLMLLGCCQ